jgi:Contractile injection system tube protein
MTTFPGAPRLTKGAIVALHPSTGLIMSVVAFQYNPETLSRSLSIQDPNAETKKAKSTTQRSRASPQESIQLEIELDATDELEKANPLAVRLGVHPQLAALEMLVYPTSVKVAANMIKAAVGTVEVAPLASPLTILAWGLKRIVPVQLTSLSITEEAYDATLNPIRAKVSLGLRILNYEDFPWTTLGGKLFFSHHVQKEILGRGVGSTQGAATTIVNIPAALAGTLG